MMVKYPPPNSCFSLFVNNRLFLLFLYFSKWILVPDPARLMQIYSAFKLINDTLQFNDYSLLSLKGFQMQVLLFALCCDIRSWIGKFHAANLEKALFQGISTFMLVSFSLSFRFSLHRKLLLTTVVPVLETPGRWM